jgi:hypothetical protein
LKLRDRLGIVRIDSEVDSVSRSAAYEPQFEYAFADRSTIDVLLGRSPNYLHATTAAKQTSRTAVIYKSHIQRTTAR